MQISKPTIFVVEHMEEYIYNWCKYQYIQMLTYLHNSEIALIFSNSKSFLEYKGNKSQQNQVNIKQVQQAYLTYSNQGYFMNESYTEHIDKNQGRFCTSKFGQFSLSEICLLDMRGKQSLKTQDSNKYRIYVFGGILGDHPPRDRTKALRNHCEVMRHISVLQLSTDTAVLTTKLILKQKMELQNIPFIQQPQIIGLNKKNQKTIIQMEGFRYISDSLNYKTGQTIKQENKGKISQVLMNPGVRKILLEEELDYDAFL